MSLRRTKDIIAVIVALCIALCVANGSMLHAQRGSATGRVPAESALQPPVKAAPRGKFVTLNLRDVSLKTALDAIVTQTGIELLYGDRVVPLQRKVSITVDRVPVVDALRLVLRGTGVNVKVAVDGQMTLVKMDTRAAGASAPGQGTGIVLGTISDARRRGGLPYIQIAFEELKIATTSNENGRYVLRVPAGTHVLTVRALGYQVLRKQIEVSAGDTINADLSLTAVATQLTDVVTTGSGDRARVEVGHTVEKINADSIMQLHTIRSLDDLLAARVPGVQIGRPSGAVGGPRRTLIRGMQSMVGSNNPIYILDGVRISDAVGLCVSQFETARCSDVPSRIGDLDPDNIESVDVLKGSAASTLYGSDAANGVIVIKTKRGQAGPTRWNARVDQGYSYHRASNYPALTKAFGFNTIGNYGECSLVHQASGRCAVVDTVIRTNNLADPNITPLARGRTTDVGIDVSGGVPSIQYFLSAGHTDQLAANKMPNAVVALIRRAKGGAPVSEDARRPSAQKMTNATARLTGQLGSGRDFSISSYITRRDNRRGPDGLSDAYSVRMADDTSTLMNAWREFFWDRNERTIHNTSSAQINWVATPWLSTRATYGLDFSLRDFKDIAPRGACTPLCGADNTNLALGRIEGGRESNFTHTVDAGIVFDIPVRSFRFRTSTGAQYVRAATDVLRGEQSNLQFGQEDFSFGVAQSTTISNGFILPTSIDRSTNQTATAGVYVEQSLSFRERLFVNVAARRDMSSQFGENADPPVYPKFNVSWLASDEPFFPWRRWMSLRLRGAYGQAGKPPASTARLRTFYTNAFFVNDDGSANTYTNLNSLGNLLIRPERTIEREYGFDAGFLQDRVQLSFQRFHKFTRDALVPKPLPPSLGATSTFSGLDENIGNVRNVGNEFTISARILDGGPVSLSSRLTFASRHNTLVTLGTGVTPFNFSGSEVSRVAQGYPLYGRWARPVLDYADSNGDGLIAREEVVIGDSLVYLGPQLNPYDLTFSPTLGLLNERLRIAADFQYNARITQVNQFLAERALSLPVTNTPGAGSLQDLAYAAAADLFIGGGTGSNTLYGYIETANLLRFNSLSVSYRLPDRVARLLRGRTATVALAGENLALWTNYSGRDPENSRSAGNFGPGVPNNAFADNGQLGQPAQWTMRLNLNF